jgi:hypothetical protein
MLVQSLKRWLWLVPLLVLLCSDRALADAILSVQAIPANPAAGSSFAVDVKISGATDVYGFQFDLLFNPGILAGTGVAEGTFLSAGGPTFFSAGTIDNVGGSVSSTFDSLVSFVPGVNGNGTLAVLNFNALAAGTSALSLANVLLVDSFGLPITGFSTSPGSVTIGGRTAVPEPSSLLLLGAGLAAMLVAAALRKLFG